MPRPALRSFVAPHIEIQYVELGSPTGSPVFLLHGFPDSPSTWAGVAHHLRSSGLRLIAPFVRGTGGTQIREQEHLSGQTAALASDVFTLADGLGIDTFHILGQDWGARTAYAAAALSPERVRGCVALANPYVPYGGRPLPPNQVQAYWYQWYLNTEHGGEAFAKDPISFCEALWRAWSPARRFQQTEYAEAAQAFGNAQFVPIVLHSYRERWKTAPGLPVYNSAEALLAAKPPLDVPVIYGFGTADACILPESGDEAAPWFRAFYRRVPFRGVGHFPQREDPKGVARLLLSLLSQTGERR